MKAKYLLILLIISYTLLSGCAIRVMPIYLIPTPQSTYGNNQVSISYYPSKVVIGSQDLNNISTSLDLQISDTLVSILFTEENSATRNSLSYGIFVGKNIWLTTENYKYPWGCLYVGIHPSVIFYEETNESYYKKNQTYFPLDLNFGFKPGIYRENYNINFLLRSSVGLTIPLGYYFSGGIGIQGNVFLGNIGLGINAELTPAVGGIQFTDNYGALLIGLAPLINVYLLVKF